MTGLRNVQHEKFELCMKTFKNIHDVIIWNVVVLVNDPLWSLRFASKYWSSLFFFDKETAEEVKLIII